MSKINEIDEKQQPGDVSGTEVDETSSLDTITALVAEGMATPLRNRLILGLSDSNGAYLDHQHEIKLRTMSWQKTAVLLAGDQVCLAIMAQSWSLS